MKKLLLPLIAASVALGALMLGTEMCDDGPNVRKRSLNKGKRPPAKKRKKAKKKGLADVPCPEGMIRVAKGGCAFGDIKDVQEDLGPYDPRNWDHPLPPPNIDLDVQINLERLVNRCTIDVDTCAVKECVGEQLAKFDELIRKTGRINALETMAAALSPKNPHLMTAAANRLGSYLFKQLDGLQPNATKAPDLQATRRLMEGLSKVRGCQALKVVASTVHAAILNGWQDKLLKIVDAHENRDELQPIVYRNFMLFGRLRGLETIKAVLSDPKAEAIHQNAILEAIRTMPEPTDEEKAELCPLATTWLTHKDANQAGQAMQILINCGKESIDSVLSEAQTRQRTGSFQPSFLKALDTLCLAKGSTGTRLGNWGQCGKMFTFLASLVDDSGLTAALRAEALWSIYQQRRDQETFDLMLRHRNHPLRPVRAKARSALRLLVERDGVKAVLPEDPRAKMQLKLAECTGYRGGTTSTRAITGLEQLGDLLAVRYAQDLQTYRLEDGKPCSLRSQRQSNAKTGLRDPAFVHAVALSPKHYLVSTSDGHSYVSDRRGRKQFTCSNSGMVVKGASTETLVGVTAKGTRQRVLIKDEACELTPLGPHPFKTVGATLNDQPHLLIGGTLRQPDPNDAKAIVIAYTHTGREAFRFGTRFVDEDGFSQVDALTRCAPGLCVLDATQQSITVWTPRGNFLTHIKLAELPGLSQHKVVALRSHGEQLLLGANYIGSGSEPGGIKLLQGLHLPEPSPLPRITE